jgi:hypothetical protein
MSADPIASDSAARSSLTLTPISASKLLLGPELYSLYTTWQIELHAEDPKQYASEAKWMEICNAVAMEPLGQISRPLVYKKFMERQVAVHFPRDEDSEPEEEELERGDDRTAPGLLVATLCRHSLHSGNTCRVSVACPVCHMRVCVASLKRIAHVWNLLGGPGTGKPTDRVQQRIYLACLGLWRVEKKRWTRLVYAAVGFADMERNWEMQALQVGSSISEDVKRSKSCIKALEIVRESPFLADGWDASFVPKPTVRARNTPEAGLNHQGMSSSASTYELPHSPPLSPESAKTKLQQELPLQCNGTQDTPPPDDKTPWLAEEDKLVACAHNNNYQRPPSPPTSPELVSSSSISPLHSDSPPSPLSSSVSFGTDSKHVTFAATTIDHPRREPEYCRPKYYNRNCPIYKRGEYAPPGGEWQDTSFYRDQFYSFTASGRR